MSEQRIIVSSTIEPAVNFIKRPAGIAKRIAYYNEIRNQVYTEHSLLLRDGYVYYSYNVFKVKQGGKDKYYMKLTSKTGFTVDPKGKCSVWFKGSLDKINLEPILDALKLDWITKLYKDRYSDRNPFISLLTPSMLGKVIKGKITNPVDLCKAYIKSIRIKMSPALLCKLIKSKTGYSHKGIFLKYIYAAKNPDHALEYLIKISGANMSIWDRIDYGPAIPHVEIIDDMIRQADILDKKIDFRWSAKRAKEEHDSWTTEIMAAEMDTMEDEETFPHQFYEATCEGFTPLKTKKEIFAEGRKMRHCVYTNYYREVKDGTYVVYHTSINGEEATLGIRVTRTGLQYHQCNGKGNNTVKDKTRVEARDFIEWLNTAYFPKGKAIDGQYPPLRDVPVHMFEL